jgi:tetratricopeptide (TPR) repeat protein
VYSHLAVATFGTGESPQEILEGALAKHPNASELKVLLGICAFLRDDPELRRQGEDRLREAIETAEDETSVRACAAVACFNLGVHSYQRPGGLKQAEALFRWAIRLRPGYPRAHFGLANALSLQGKTGDAIQAYRKTIQLQPDDAAAYQNLGFLLNRQGNHANATEVLKRAIFHDPTRAHAWYFLAQARRHTEKLDEACQAILNALEQSPSRSEYWAEYFYIGSLYHVQGQAARALPIYRAVVT